jgi:hypothetical protein
MNISRGALWFGFLGGLAAWALHLTITYLLVYNGCVLGLASLRMWLVVVTVILALVTLAAVAMAYRVWRRVTDIYDSEHDSEGEIDFTRVRFVALMGIWLSGLSFLILVLVSIPILSLRPCG